MAGDKKSGAPPPASFMATAGKVLLWLFAWVVVTFYLDQWVMMPLDNGRLLWASMRAKFVPNKQCGRPGANLLLLTAPFIVVAVVAGPYVELRKAYPAPRISVECVQAAVQSLWTRPVVARGPFGMLNAVEILGFVMVVWITLWHMWKYTIEQFDLIDAEETDNILVT